MVYEELEAVVNLPTSRYLATRNVMFLLSNKINFIGDSGGPKNE